MSTALERELPSPLANFCPLFFVRFLEQALRDIPGPSRPRTGREAGIDKFYSAALKVDSYFNVCWKQDIGERPGM